MAYDQQLADALAEVAALRQQLDGAWGEWEERVRDAARQTVVVQTELARVEIARRTAEADRDRLSGELQATRHELGARDWLLGQVEAERDRLLVVYRAAEVYRETWYHSDAPAAFFAALNSYRSAAPAEPAPANDGDTATREEPTQQQLIETFELEEARMRQQTAEVGAEAPDVSADLHSRLRAAIQEKLDLAKTLYGAAPGRWTVESGKYFWLLDGDGDRLAEVGHVTDAEFIAAHDPADAIRRHEAALELLDWLVGALVVTVTDDYDLDVATPMIHLADAYGVPVDTEEAGDADSAVR